MFLKIKFVNFLLIIGFNSLLFLSCDGRKSKGNDLESINFKNDSLIIYNKIFKGDIMSWQFFDEFEDESVPYFFINEKKDTTIKLKLLSPVQALTIDVDKTKKYFNTESWTWFTFFPGESLIAYKDKNGNTRLVSKSDSIRTNEFDFIVDLKLNVEGIVANNGIISAKLSVEDQVKQAESRANKALFYLENYRKPLSVSFKNNIKTYFRYDVIYYMMRSYFSPFIVDSFRKPFLNKKEPVYDTLITFFRHDEYISVSTYKSSAFLYAYFLCHKNNLLPSLENLFLVSRNSFFNKTRDYVLFKIVKMKMEQDGGVEEVKVMVNQFYKYCTNKDYIDYVRKNMSVIEIRSSSWKKDIDSSFVVNRNLDKVSINNLIQMSKNKILYLDFWASWCKPCLEEMPWSHKLYNEYKSKKVNFVYISLDKSRVAWENGMIRAKLNQSKDSYLLINGSKSAFAKHFKIFSIPRYMIIDKDGKVINADAPRPSDPKIRELFDELLKK